MIYRTELKRHIKSIIWISLGIALMLYWVFFEYETYQNSEGIDEIMQAIPKIVRVVLGFGDFGFQKLSSIFAVIWLYVALICLFYFSYLGNKVTSKSERVRVEEAVLLPRKKVFFFKMLAHLTIIVILIAYIFAFSYLMLIWRKETDFTYLYISVYLLLGVSLASYGLGLLTGLSKFSYKISSGIPLGIIFVLYLIPIFTSMFDNNNLRYLSPFTVLSNKEIINGNTEIPYFVGTLIFFLVSVPISYFFYKKRDL